MEAVPPIPGRLSAPVDVAVSVLPPVNVNVNVMGMSDSVPGALTMESVMFPNGVTVPEPERLAPIGMLPVPWPDALMEI